MSAYQYFVAGGLAALLLGSWLCGFIFFAVSATVIIRAGSPLDNLMCRP